MLQTGELVFNLTRNSEAPLSEEDMFAFSRGLRETSAAKGTEENTCAYVHPYAHDASGVYRPRGFGFEGSLKGLCKWRWGWYVNM